MEQQQKCLIIGGGITGLSAGITWAKNMHITKNPVVILEKNNRVGGYVVTNEKDGYMFDIQQFIPDVFGILNNFGIKLKLKQYQGVFARLVLVDPVSKASKSFKLPASIKGFEYWLINNYPKDAKKIKRFFITIKKMYKEFFSLKSSPSPIDALGHMVYCRRIVKYKNKTFKQFIDSYNFTNSEIIEILHIFANFSGLSSERVSCLLPIIKLNLILNGVYRPFKGFSEISEKLHERYTSLGGETKLNTTVSEIIVENGKVKGAKTNNGEFIEADYIISTLSPKVTFGGLISLEKVKNINSNYINKIGNLKMSSSTIQISLGLDTEINLNTLGLESAYNLITTGENTFEELFKSFDKNELGLNDSKFQVGVVCPFANSGEKNVVVISVMAAPMMDWSILKESNTDEYNQKKEKIAGFFISLVEKHLIPNLSKHILVKEVATPTNFEDTTSYPEGAVFGMGAYTDNFGITRLPTKTPFEGLLQPSISHGIMPSMISGMQAIDIITKGRVMNGYVWYRNDFN